MNYQLSIADMILNLQGDFALPFNFAPFLTEEGGPPCVACTVTEGEPYQIEQPPIHSSFLRTVYREEGGYVHVIADPTGEQLGYARMDARFSSVELVANARRGVTGAYLLRYFPIGTLLSNQGGVYFHASCVVYQGEGILFTAPSGTGKSTQADIWCKEKGASLLNGDRVAVRMRDGVPVAYGSPWAGSSDVFLQESCPVRAIVLLGQAKENHVESVGANGLFALMEQAELPLWEEGLAQKSFASLDAILKAVNVLSLRCVPDGSAADALLAALS